MLAPMNDLQLGMALRTIRVKRRMRQCDLAAQAGVSASVVSRLEHGRFGRLSIVTLRAIAAKLGVSLDIVARSAGGELDRIVSARHAALGELVATWISRQRGWLVAAETSFAIYGERGLVDLLALHQATGALVVIELKTAIIDVDELIGTLDRKRRLAARIAAERGWVARSISVWLVVANSKTNRRRVSEHRTLLTSALPLNGRSLPPLFRHPERGPASGIAFWTNLTAGTVSHPIAAQQRVLKVHGLAATADSRSGSRRAAG
jgi:transcriptional regulator with XRE-family HTH domain